jgi:hypothetical protein
VLVVRSGTNIVSAIQSFENLFAEDADFGLIPCLAVDINREVFKVIDEFLEIFRLDLRKSQRNTMAR